MSAPDFTPPGPEADLPGMIRRHPNGTLYARRELEPSRSTTQYPPWVAITLPPSPGQGASHLYDEDLEGSTRVAVMPGTPAAYAATVDLTLTVNDREGAVDQLASALLKHWCTDYAYEAKPWGALREEHQRAFRRRARAVLPVLDRWTLISQQLVAAAQELGGDRG